MKGICAEFDEIVAELPFHDGQIRVADRVAGGRHAAFPFPALQVGGHLIRKRRFRTVRGRLPALVLLVFKAPARTLERLFLAPELRDLGQNGINFLVELLGHQFHIDIAQDRIAREQVPDPFRDFTDAVNGSHKPQTFQ